MRSILFLATALIVSTLSARAADCPKAAISTAAADLQDARNALMVLPPDKPKDAALAEMEMRVADFLFAYMRCQPENPDIEGIEVDLARLGWASAPNAAPPGWALIFKAESFGQGLIGLSATYAVPNGSETVAVTFRHEDEGWSETGRHADVTPH